MKFNGWFLIWLAVGLYAVIATIGGSPYCAGVAMFCGFMAGRSLRRGKHGNEC